MKRAFYVYALVWSLLLITQLGWTAEAQTRDTLRVMVRANAKKDMIQLRWVVNSPLAWTQTNRNGFIVERYTVVRNNQIVSPAEKVVLTAQPLKPRPLNDWQTLATANQYAAVIAQALYGQDFQLTGDDAKGISKMMAMAQELEQRYLVSMYAADLCYPAALLAGWAYEDNTVKPGERYLYRVVAAPAPKAVKINQGAVYVSLQDAQLLPEPQPLTAIFGDKSVMLSWNYALLSKVYNAYYLEKSVDGKNFKKLSDTPLTNMNSREGKSADRMFYMDTLANNTTSVFYRLQGVSSFGEEGPVSPVVSGHGEMRLIYVPHIESVIPNDKGGVDIRWSFDERGNQDIQEFQLQRGDRDQGPFVPVMRGIGPASRQVQFQQLQASNYLVIAAIPRQGEPVLSFPVLVQPADSVPPAMPTGLAGTVDSLGVVRLSWKSNTESDLLGYRIYRAQTQGEELVPITDVAIREASFVDTLQIKSLNPRAFYAVAALDQRYNQSSISPTITLQKPETVPPSTPIITDYKVTADGIQLRWETGREENLSFIEIHREASDAPAVVLASIKDLSVQQHVDAQVEAGQRYRYKIVSVSAGGLRSAPSPTVTLQAKARQQTGKIESFIARRNRREKAVELSWVHSLKSVKEVTIYRGVAGKPVSLWRVMKGFETQIKDNDVQENESYEYIIRAVLADGKTGATAQVKIQY